MAVFAAELPVGACVDNIEEYIRLVKGPDRQCGQCRRSFFGCFYDADQLDPDTGSYFIIKVIGGIDVCIRVNPVYGVYQKEEEKHEKDRTCQITVDAQTGKKCDGIFAVGGNVRR